MSAFALKLIAILAMLTDHLANVLPLSYVQMEIMHFIGRLTCPIMCYFIAEGYYHTKNVRKYALRLLAFSVISYLPYILYQTGSFPTWKTFTHLNVLWSLFCGLLALWSYKRISSPMLKIMMILGMLTLSLFGDWSFYAVLFVLTFGVNHGKFKKQVLWYILAASIWVTYVVIKNPVWNIFQTGVYLAPFLLCSYNGKRGGECLGRFSKWLFYLFYPIHLLILAFLFRQ